MTTKLWLCWAECWSGEYQYWYQYSPYLVVLLLKTILSTAQDNSCEVMLKELEKELYLVIVTDMLLHQVHFPGIWFEKNTLCCLRVQGLVISWQFKLDNYWPGTCTLLFDLKGDTTYTPSAHLFDLLSPLERLFGSWHYTKFPTDRQKNPASCTLILANSTSWGAVKS